MNFYQISFACFQLGSIAHEIGHAVGFWHEHQRTDRDNYVIIHGENARTQKERVYSLELKGTTANLLPYDYGSLMHYRAWVSLLIIHVFGPVSLYMCLA